MQIAAIRALEPLIVGRPVETDLADMAAFSRNMVGDSQLRWLGPEKGAIHMAAGAVVNAVWDLAARTADKPLWKLLADLSPQQLVDLVDFRYLRDAINESEALEIVTAAIEGRADREAQLLANGYPAYTTTPGWLGYDDEKLALLSRQAVEDGFGLIKLKVGGNLADDVRRLAIARDAVGPDVPIAVDANQIWGVDEAIEWMEQLRSSNPYWIEEPTSPDDILGHAAVRKAVAPIRVATGEHAQNAVIFKQLLQAGAVDIVQIDACRVGGVNENIAILLLAAKFGVPVCPHAGGVGLCEMVQHLAMFDYLAVSDPLGRPHDRVRRPPARALRRSGDDHAAADYVAPRSPGGGAQLHPASVAEFDYPDGPQWRSEPVLADRAGGSTLHTRRADVSGR